jgi:hypothetical protein
VGYDLHITRALFWPEADRFPIRVDEMFALLEGEPDLAMLSPGDSRLRSFFISVGVDDWLQFHSGRLSTKHPRPSLIHRMVEIGSLLDAWVVGDDGEIYGWDGDVATRQPTREEMSPPAHHLIGAASPRGYSWESPIAQQAWLDLASTQPDFIVMPWVEALLPSGRRWIPCPRVAYWTGHPSGCPVPFFFADDDHVEAANDPAILARLRELAPLLDARVVDDDLESAEAPG